jgi:hypothetical protein
VDEDGSSNRPPLGKSDNGEENGERAYSDSFVGSSDNQSRHFPRDWFGSHGQEGYDILSYRIGKLNLVQFCAYCYEGYEHTQRPSSLIYNGG